MPSAYLFAVGFCIWMGKESKINMYAIIKSGGLQHKVSVGEKLEVNRLHVGDGEQIAFDEVLLISDENTTMIGTPLVENAVVLATAVRQSRGKKLIVFKYKSKKRYRHRRGHRQELTLLTIDDIVANGKSLITGNPPVPREAPEEGEGEGDSSEMTETTGEVSEQRTSRRRRTSSVEQTDPDVDGTETESDPEE